MIRFFLRHPTSSNLLMVIFLILGMLALPQLRRETFPEFIPEQVSVTVSYPGATARDIEEAVNEKLEDALNSVRDIREIRSEARDGMAIVTVEMLHGGDATTFLNDIKTEVEAIDDLPEQTEKPVIRALGQTTHVVSIAVTGPMDASVLKLYSDSLRRELKALPGVSQVELKGFSDHQFQILASQSLLHQHGLSVAELAKAISSQNIDLPSGSLQSDQQEVTLRFSDERRSIRDLENLIVVESATGGRVLLKDVAQVVDTFEMDEDKLTFDGRRMAIIDVSKTDSQDMLRVFAVVKDFVENKMKVVPPGVTLELTNDMTSIVKDRLKMLVENGIQGFILVFLALFLFFDLRFSLWVSMGLPVSFLGGLFFFPVLGQTLNMVSMVALLMGIGLLMDDAIVISENIASHMAKGKTSFQAALDGVNEIKSGVLSSFATTAVVFVPLLTIQGQMGRVLKPIPIVLLIILTVSLVEAFLILPHHLAHSLDKKASRPPSKRRQRIEDGLNYFKDKILGRLVDFTVKWRYLTLGLTLLLFFGSLALLSGGIIKVQAFPDMDGDVLEARLLLPQGTPLIKTEKIVQKILSVLDDVNEEFRPQQPDEADLIEHRTVEFGIHTGLGERGPQAATVRVDLLPSESRNATIAEISESWRKRTEGIPDVLSLSFAEPGLGPQGKAIEIRISGYDLDKLHRASTELRRWMNGFSAVKDLDDDMKPGRPELRIIPRPGAKALGLSASDMAAQMRNAFYGQEADNFQVGTESYEVNVRLRDSDRKSSVDLENFPILLPGGEQAPLSSLADIKLDRFWSRIHRTDGIRTVTITGDVDTRFGNTAEILGQLKRKYLPDFESKHPGVSVVLEGESSETAETQSSMRRALLLGVLGIFVLLSFQFRSYIEPLVVLIAIPFAFIGVVFGNFVMGYSISMPGIMGFVSLAGVVVNNSILLVEFIRIGLAQGLTLEEAAKAASKERFRAMLLTSLTTIAGMTPLLFERSLQAQLLIPLAISVVFGLLASTVLVLAVLPALYTILGDMGWIREEIRAN